MGELEGEDDGFAEGGDDWVKATDILRADASRDGNGAFENPQNDHVPENPTSISSGWITSEAIWPAAT